MQVYFDNSATTKPCEKAVKAMINSLEELWGNPSSLHYEGVKAEKALECARVSVAKALGCESGEIFFTSGGTESNNLAIFGAVEKMKRLGKRIISSTVEHPSVNEALNKLENEGFQVVRVPLNKDRELDEQALFEAVTKDTILVTLMLVNNELGTIMPVQSAKSAILRAKSPALLHVDAVQAFGKLPFTPSSLGADMVSISSHKTYGPKGAGALYVKKGTKLAPQLFGGEQENKLRPGTEATPAIVGFGTAVENLGNISEQLERISELKDYLLAKLSKIDGVEINSPVNALPYITNISVISYKSETMLNFLSSKGICVSSGSACSKGKKSKVLVAAGLSRQAIDSALRISFSRYTTKNEIDYFVNMLALAKEEIRAVR